MFNYGFPQFNNLPTATPQPYGYPMQQQPVQQQTQTNIIYVNGIDDVKNRQLPPNSNYAFMDNDKPIIYRKIVDAQGKMSVEIFDIVPHKEIPEERPDYALKSDLAQIQSEINKIRADLNKYGQNTVVKSV